MIDFDSVNASISALPVSEEVKEAFRNHTFGAHTTAAQLAELLDSISVATLVLHHFVPADIGRGGWKRVARELGRGRASEVIAAEDGAVVGV